MKVSYIITTFQRKEALKRHFGLIEKQTIKPDEVLVCDDGSTDGTKELTKKRSYRYFNTGKTDTFNAAESRNNGIRNAKHDIIIMTDVDCLPHPRLIEEYVKNFNQNEIQIGYRSSREEYLGVDPDNFEVEEGKMKIYESRNTKIPYGMFTSGNACMRREASQIMYNEKFTGYGYEDSEFAYRLHQEGYYFIWNKKSIIYHMHPSSTFQIEPKRKEEERKKNHKLLLKLIK